MMPSSITTQKPHVPTLGVAIIAIIVIVILYHLLLGRKK